MEWSLLKSNKLYKWPFSVTNNTKLMFQFKIEHNIIYTRDNLKKPTLYLMIYATYAKVGKGKESDPTDVSAHTSANASVDVGRQDCRVTVGQQSADSWPTR